VTNGPVDTKAQLKVTCMQHTTPLSRTEGQKMYLHHLPIPVLTYCISHPPTVKTTAVGIAGIRPSSTHLLRRKMRIVTVLPSVAITCRRSHTGTTMIARTSPRIRWRADSQPYEPGEKWWGGEMPARPECHHHSYSSPAKRICEWRGSSTV
jgi:hypothetical protein